MATKLICCRKSKIKNFAFGFILKELSREIANERKSLNSYGSYAQYRSNVTNCLKVEIRNHLNWIQYFTSRKILSPYLRIIKVWGLVIKPKFRLLLLPWEDPSASFFWGLPYTGFVTLGLRFFPKVIFSHHFLIRHTVFLSYSGAFDSCFVSYPSNLSLGIRSP